MCHVSLERFFFLYCKSVSVSHINYLSGEEEPRVGGLFGPIRGFRALPLGSDTCL